MRRWVLAATAMIAVGAVMVVTSRVTETCPASWEGAQRVEISGASANAYIRMDAFHLYAVSGTAMLDYSLSAVAHPLNVTMHVSAGSRDDLRDAVYTCVRVHHGADTWASRPRNLDVNSPLDDAGPSDRIAAAAGPEWAAGDQIDMEGWLQIGGQRFVVVFPSFVLIKGG